MYNLQGKVFRVRPITFVLRGDISTLFGIINCDDKTMLCMNVGWLVVLGLTAL